MAESPCPLVALNPLVALIEAVHASLREEEDRHARLRCLLDFQAKQRDIAFAERKAAVKKLQQARAKRHFWAVRVQLWKGLIKLRHACIKLALRKSRSDSQDRNWYRRVLRKEREKIDVLESRTTNVAADAKKLQQDFEQLRGDYMKINSLGILPKIPVPIHLDSPPVPRYTLQV